MKIEQQEEKYDVPLPFPGEFGVWNSRFGDSWVTRGAWEGFVIRARELNLVDKNSTSKDAEAMLRKSFSRGIPTPFSRFALKDPETGITFFVAAKEEDENATIMTIH